MGVPRGLEQQKGQWYWPTGYRYLARVGSILHTQSTDHSWRKPCSQAFPDSSFWLYTYSMARPSRLPDFDLLQYSAPVILMAIITYNLQPLQSRGRGWGRWMLADCHVGSRAPSSPRWRPCGYWHDYGPRGLSEEVPRAGSPPQHSAEGWQENKVINHRFNTDNFLTTP